MENIDWNIYKGREVSFINPKNTDAGYQYNAVLIGLELSVSEEMNVQITDSEGNLVLIPVELAPTYIHIHSDGPTSDLED